MYGYDRAIQRHRPLPEAQVIELLKRYKKGCIVSKQKIILHHLGFVAWYANRFQRQGIDLLDLIQEGLIGVSEAIDNCDPSHKTRFLTYAVFYIRRNILKCRAKALKNNAISLEFDIADDRKNIVEDDRENLAQQVIHTFNQLDDKEQDVIRSRYFREHPEDFRSIAKRYGIKQFQAKAIRSRALKKMRKNNPGLRQFLEVG